MKVLLLTHRLPYAPNRGDRIRAYHILELLAGAAEVHLVSLVSSSDEDAMTAHLSAMTASVSTVRRSPVRNAAAALANLVSGRPMTHALLDGPAMADTLRRVVAAHRPEVVLAYGSGMARFALDPALAPLPFLLDMVDVDSVKWRQLSKSGNVVRRWIYSREARTLGRFEIEAAHKAAATTLVNERERAILARRAPGAGIAVVPNGVDLDEFRPVCPPEPGLDVVFCGMMDYLPNVNAMIWLAREVWPRVRAARPGARLTIVGARPTRSVRRLADRDATIQVTGSVADVRPFLWRSAVSVAPLWLARGVQNKVLEALASGLPVVVTPAVIEGLPAQVAPGCVVAATADAFADAIVDLITRTPGERRAMAGRADIQSLAWEPRLRPLLSLLQAAARGVRRDRHASLPARATG